MLGSGLPCIIGILNVTPDSFSDGGVNRDPVAAGRALIEAGANILDIGGESTRPGAAPVPPDAEQRRIVPVIAALARESTRISVDTRHASTMRAALAAGATIINDVSSLRHDRESAAVVAQAGCTVVLMHSRGTPETMRSMAVYDDAVVEIRAELAAIAATAIASGVARDRIVLDPGFGFAKTAAQNLELLRGLGEIVSLGFPVLVGVSRKSFIGTYGGEPEPRRRGPGSLAAALFALSKGATALRVHDVAETVQAVRMWQALTDWAKERGSGVSNPSGSRAEPWPS